MTTPHTNTLKASGDLSPALWYKVFFTELYWDFFMKRSIGEIKQETLIIRSLVNEPAQSVKVVKSVLDVCCGVGDILEQLSIDMRIPCHLAQGIELSPDYVRLARSRATPLNILGADALVLQTTYPTQFDLVLNWYSSYAYFSPEDTQKLFDNCYAYTAHAGTFLLEAYSSEAVLANFQSEFSYDKKLADKKYKITRHSQIEPSHDNFPPKLKQKWIFEEPGANRPPQIHETYTYMYSIGDIKAMLTKAGFKDITVYGRTASHELIQESDFMRDIKSIPRFVVKGVR